MNEVAWSQLEEELMDSDFQDWLLENDPEGAHSAAEALKRYHRTNRQETEMDKNGPGGRSWLEEACREARKPSRGPGRLWGGEG